MGIPRDWGPKAVEKLAALCPGAQQGVALRWLLNENDPTEWRGDATLVFPSVGIRDVVFEQARSLTDVHVQWDDTPGAPPLGSFLTEQSLLKSFSRHGMVVAARIPRKAI